MTTKSAQGKTMPMMAHMREHRQTELEILALPAKADARWQEQIRLLTTLAEKTDA
jgi:hypothetical protein